MKFDIKKAKKKKYQVVTEDGRSVRIVCWDMNHWRPIIGVVTKKSGDGEFIQEYTESGKVSDNDKNINDLHLIENSSLFKRLISFLHDRRINSEKLKQ